MGLWSASGGGCAHLSDCAQGSLVPCMDGIMTEDRLNEVKTGKLCPALVRLQGPARGWVGSLWVIGKGAGRSKCLRRSSPRACCALSCGASDWPRPTSGTEAALERARLPARSAVVALIRPNGDSSASHAVSRRCGRFGHCGPDAGCVEDWVRVRAASYDWYQRSGSGLGERIWKGLGQS